MRFRNRFIEGNLRGGGLRLRPPRSRGHEWILAILTLAVLLSPRFMRASDGFETQYTRRVWRIEDGLPEDTVQAIQQTSDGYLWIGTTGGLVQFDGSHFRIYSGQTDPHLTDDSIFCVLAARDGSLWMGTEGGGLLHLKDGKLQSFSVREGLTDGFVRTIAEDSGGHLWIGTDNGLFQIDQGKVKQINTSQFMQSLAVHAILEDSSHRVWVGGSRLLAFSGGAAQQYKLPGAFSQNRVKSILQTADGTLWVGTVAGLDRFVNGRFETAPEITGTVRTLRETSDGTLWIGTIGHGLFTYRQGVFSHPSGTGLLPSNTVLNVFEDSAHQVWVGTQDGLVRLSRTPVSVVPLPGAPDSDFETVSRDHDGSIWVVASNVYTIRSGVAQQHTFDRFSNVPIRNVFRDRSGDLWVGTDGSGVYHLAASGTVHYSAPKQLTNNFVRAFLQGSDGAIWIATDEGVNRILGDRVQTLRVRDGLAYFSIRALLEDKRKDVWIGTEHGLSRWHAGAFVHDEVTERLSQEKVWSILEDSSGDLWFGTRDHGLFRYSAGQLSQYTTAQGMVSNSIYQLLEDHGGRIWISGPHTISSFNLSELKDGAGDNRFLAVTAYHMPYGADGAQMYGGRQPSGCVGLDGSVWFPSNKGALHIRPDDGTSMVAPRVFIHGFVSDGRELASLSAIALTPESSRIEIAFAPLLLRSQEGLRFRYRLENFDSNWSYAGTNRTATYTNLPAGRYRFDVAAFEVNNPGVIAAASLEFVKRPHFYRTWWFLGLCIVCSLLLAWAIYRSRVRLLHLRFQDVLEERSRLAREMHDTVIQGCTSISALLEAMSSLGRSKAGPELDLLNRARIQARATIDEARETVWNLRHSDAPLPNLTTSFEAIAEHTRQEFGIEVVCRSEGRPFDVAGSSARELLMVMREAAYNAALHGRPSKIEILLFYAHNEVVVTLRDDGIGFDPEATKNGNRSHYGIAGMYERVKQLDGRIELESAIGQGTRVCVRIKRSDLKFKSRTAIEI